MSTLTLHDCIKFVNLTKTTIVQEKPWKELKGKWSIHEGKHKIHHDEYPFKLVYLNTNISVADFSQAFIHLHPVGDKIHLIYPDSNKLMIERNSEVFKNFKRVLKFTSKEYILSFISSEIDSYKRTIGEIDVNYYIDPKIETPSSFTATNPNPIKQFINDIDKDIQGKIGILKAEPGQGKTYLCQYLTKDAIRSKFFYVPLLIQSNQWTRMAVDDLKSIAKTVINGLKSFGANISWAEGQEDEFIRITLKADIFRLIFDGFDEYILKNSFSEKPEDVLGYLIALTRDSGARVVITTRTSFWAANIDENNFMSDLYVYELCPFDVEIAKKYFTKRLSNRADQDYAKNVFKSLVSKNKDIAGRGFVLSLVADLSEKSALKKIENHRTINWLFTAFCEREQERQGLSISGQEQMLLLKDLALEIAKGLYPSDEEFGILISGIKKEMDNDELNNVIQKLKSHPLIENKNKKWLFKNEQVFYYILSQKIYEYLIADYEGVQRLIKSFYLKEKNFLSNICDWIVAIGVEEQNDEDLYRAFIKKSVQMLKSFVEISDEGLKKDDSISIFITSLIVISLERRYKSGTKEQRTGFLNTVCGDSISKLNFWGTLSSFDFSETTFENCRFENIYWSKCRFGEGTNFINCSFNSCMPLESCEDFHLVNYSKCRMDKDFELKRNLILIEKQKKEYTKEDLSADLKTVALKFITQNGLPNLSVEKNNFENRGVISRSKYKVDIIEAFKESVLEKIQISQTEGGYKVDKNHYEDFTFLYNNNTFVGELKRIYDRLCERLKL